MSIVLSILRNAHAHGTHHQLALDALGHLNAPAAADWQRLFYRYIALYLDGAKAPDTAFKDFTNHVLHPRARYWGGAPQQAATWYAETVEALRKQDWGAAAYAAGVMSHYITDPFQPLHTHQTDAENAIHAGVEWSVSRNYVALTALSQTLVVAAPDASASIEALLHAGADRATQHYETILAHYDIKRGVVSPEDGLDPVGQRAMAEMLKAAVMTLSLILDRAIVAAGVAPPSVSLAGDALHAFVRMPLSRRRHNALDADTRRQVEAMYDELMATGRVEQTLPEDERKIRELFAGLETAPTTAVLPKAAVAKPVAVAAPIVAALATQPVVEPVPQSVAPPSIEIPSALPAAAALADVKPVLIDPPASATVAPVLASYRPSPARNARAALSLDADVVDAPSIGPKMAKRLNNVGIDTVGDFLKAHPIALSSLLAHEPTTPVVLTEWQDQTRLMCALADLRAADAKLLVGAGYRTLDAITNVEPDQLSADILRYALTKEGQALLREGNVPDVERIRAWAADARAVKAA